MFEFLIDGKWVEVEVMIKDVGYFTYDLLPAARLEDLELIKKSTAFRFKRRECFDLTFEDLRETNVFIDRVETGDVYGIRILYGKFKEIADK